MMSFLPLAGRVRRFQLGERHRAWDPKTVRRSLILQSIRKREWSASRPVAYYVITSEARIRSPSLQAVASELEGVDTLQGRPTRSRFKMLQSRCFLLFGPPADDSPTHLVVATEACFAMIESQLRGALCREGAVRLS